MTRKGGGGKSSKRKGGAKLKELGRRLRPRSAAKRSELREKSNLILSSVSVVMGAASLALALNEKPGGDEIDRTAPGAGQHPRPGEVDMARTGQAQPARQCRIRTPPYAGTPVGSMAARGLRQLTPQDVESSCRGKGVRYVVLKASGGNIGTMRYRPGEAEAFLSQYGRLGYWKKERVGDTLYYYLGN